LKIVFEKYKWINLSASKFISDYLLTEISKIDIDIN